MNPPSLELDNFAARKELLQQYHLYDYSNIHSLNMTSFLISLPPLPLNEKRSRSHSLMDDKEMFLCKELKELQYSLSALPWFIGENVIK